MPMGIQYEVSKDGRMAEWSIASDLKSDELYRFREFESHSLLYIYYSFSITSTSITF